MSATRLLSAAAWLGMFLFLVSLAVSPARAQMENDYRFKGTVIDPAGKPIPEVRVTLHDPNTGATISFKTEKDGTFDRQMIPHGSYDASFEKEGYVTHKEHFDWSAVERQTIEKIARIVLESQAEQAQKELGKKEAKLYQDAYAALQSGDCTTATQKAQELLKLGAGGYEYAVRFVIARCDAMQGKAGDAINEYRTVLTLKPDLFEAHFDLGGLLEKADRHDEALREYGLAAAANPNDAETEYQIGVILLQAKQNYDEARPHLRRALELDSSHVQATKALGLADLWAQDKDIPEGVALLNKYLELAPKASDAAQIREIIKSFESAPAKK